MYRTINNQQIYYQSTGKGPDLIMLHGWKQDLSTFWPVVELLKTSFTLWLIDLPGFGRSAKPKDSWKVADFADLIAGFIKQEKISKPIVLGHSVGGRIAIKLAAKYPDCLSRLILEDAAGIPPSNSSLKLPFYIAAKIIKQFLPNWFNLKSRLRHKLYRSLQSDYDDAGELKQVFLNLISEDLTPDLKKIVTETLVIWGENDDMVPQQDGLSMYQLIKSSRLEIIDGAGHFPHLNNPVIFTNYVKDFA